MIGAHSVCETPEDNPNLLTSYLDAGLASAEAGLDVTMPSSVFWGRSGGNLTAAVNNGSLSESRVTDMATRLIASWYQMGQDVSWRVDHARSC